MSLEKYRKDLNKLEDIAHAQNDRINLSSIFFTCKFDQDELAEVLDFFSEKGIDVVSEDVELDSVEVDIDRTVKPFDPSQINIKMDKITIDSIIKRIKNDELEMDSSFQRKKGLWNLKQKSQLIESIFLKIPLPAFYFDATNDDRWQIIDGLQRIWTIKQYVIDQAFTLKGLEFLKDFEDLKFSQLPRSMQRRIEETNLNAYLVNPSTPLNVKFNIFKRINTGGLVLESQEIRNALYQGQATEFLIEMANIDEFKEATDYSIRSDRMQDREFCLRYVTITRLGIDGLVYGMDEFLNQGMEYLSSAPAEELAGIRAEFIKVMSAAKDIFGKYAFRKVNSEGRRAPVNKYLFEGWSLILSGLDDSDIDVLKQRKDVIYTRLIEICDMNDFQSLLRSSDKNSARGRINRLKDIIGDMADIGEYL